MENTALLRWCYLMTIIGWNNCGDNPMILKHTLAFTMGYEPLSFTCCFSSTWFMRRNRWRRFMPPQEDGSGTADARCQTYPSKVVQHCRFTKKTFRNIMHHLAFLSGFNPWREANSARQIISYPAGKQLHSSTENNPIWCVRTHVRVCVIVCMSVFSQQLVTANNSLHFFICRRLKKKGSQRCITLFQTSKHRCTRAQTCTFHLMAPSLWTWARH